MSVIGRLDDQVEDVLIAPLEKKNSKINREPAENPFPDKRDENTRHEVDQRERRDSLPVWLL
jgi:hypothetical protein